MLTNYALLTLATDIVQYKRAMEIEMERIKNTNTLDRLDRLDKPSHKPYKPTNKSYKPYDSSKICSQVCRRIYCVMPIMTSVMPLVCVKSESLSISIKIKNYKERQHG
jgi:hypothetical protein